MMRTLRNYSAAINKSYQFFRLDKAFFRERLCFIRHTNFPFLVGYKSNLHQNGKNVHKKITFEVFFLSLALACQCIDGRLELLLSLIQQLIVQFELLFCFLITSSFNAPYTLIVNSLSKSERLLYFLIVYMQF